MKGPTSSSNSGSRRHQQQQQVADLLLPEAMGLRRSPHSSGSSSFAGTKWDEPNASRAEQPSSYVVDGQFDDASEDEDDRDVVGAQKQQSAAALRQQTQLASSSLRRRSTVGSGNKVSNRFGSGNDNGIAADERPGAFFRVPEAAVGARLPPAAPRAVPAPSYPPSTAASRFQYRHPLLYRGSSAPAAATAAAPAGSYAAASSPASSAADTNGGTTTTATTGTARGLAAMAVAAAYRQRVQQQQHYQQHQQQLLGWPQQHQQRQLLPVPIVPRPLPHLGTPTTTATASAAAATPSVLHNSGGPSAARLAAATGGRGNGTGPSVRSRGAAAVGGADNNRAKSPAKMVFAVSHSELIKMRHPHSAILPKSYKISERDRLPVLPPPPARDQQGSGIRDGDLTDRDVLLGRGGLANTHKGNIWFRQIIDKYRVSYAMVRKFDKSELAENLANYFRLCGGRFLFKDTGGTAIAKNPAEQGRSCWYQADLAVAKKKCGQTLREGAADLVRNSLLQQQTGEGGGIEAAGVNNAGGTTAVKRAPAAKTESRRVNTTAAGGDDEGEASSLSSSSASEGDSSSVGNSSASSGNSERSITPRSKPKRKNSPTSATGSGSSSGDKKPKWQDWRNNRPRQM